MFPALQIVLQENTFQWVACSQPCSGTCTGTGTLPSVPNSPFYSAVRKNLSAQACSHDLWTLKFIYWLLTYIKFNGSVQPVAEDSQTNYRVLLSLFWKVTQNTAGELGRNCSWANLEYSPMTVKSGFYRWDHLEMLQLYNLYFKWKRMNSNLAHGKYFALTAVLIWFLSRETSEGEHFKAASSLEMFPNLDPVKGNTPKSLKHLTHPKTSAVSEGAFWKTRNIYFRGRNHIFHMFTHGRLVPELQVCDAKTNVGMALPCASPLWPQILSDPLCSSCISARTIPAQIRNWGQQ